MRRFELGMSVEYAPNWGIVEAVREFFQNALDEESRDNNNKMSFRYIEENEIIEITNKNSNLETSSLLMGESTKRSDSKYIGQYGEGYKVATAVLERNGCHVIIYNNESKEVWTSKVVNSKRYGGKKVVVYDIEKKFFDRKENLVIQITGISKSVYNDLVERNLHLRDDVGKTIETKAGRVLEDEEFKGCIYVNGLFVCRKVDLNKGYDFKPEYISLDRDRGLVDDFDLKRAISYMAIVGLDTDYIVDNLESNDMDYICSDIYIENSTDKRKEISDKVYKKFVEKYGDDAIPVDDSDYFNKLHSSGLKPIMVSGSTNKAINYVKREYNISGISKIEELDMRFYEIIFDSDRCIFFKGAKSELGVIWEELKKLCK